VKIHTLLTSRQYPIFIYISDGLLSDVNILDDLCIELAHLYHDRGYIDWERLFWIEAIVPFLLQGRNQTFPLKILSRPVDKSEGLVCDQTTH